MQPMDLSQLLRMIQGNPGMGAPPLDPMTVQSAGQAGLGQDLFKNVGARSFGPTEQQQQLFAQEQGLNDAPWWQRMNLPSLSGGISHPGAYGDTGQAGLVNSQGWSDWHNQ